MKEGNAQILVIIAGAVVGLLFGCLITWFPIRMLFCAYYNAPDCEEIVLITFPFYCFIAPLAGGIIAYFIYRKRRSHD